MCMKKPPLLLLLFLPLTALAATAFTPQNHEAIHAAATDFLRDQVRDLPGRPEIKVGEVDKRLILPECAKLEVFLPQGAQLIGKSMLGVRCPKDALAAAKQGANQGWSLFVPAQVKVSVDLVIINKPLQKGHALLAEDLSKQSGEWLQSGMLVDPALAIGKVLKYSVGAGQVLKQDMLQAPYVVMQGKPVQLQIETSGFSIHSEGRALNNGAAGQLVQIRTSSGRVVQGTARESGIVEVRP